MDSANSFFIKSKTYPIPAIPFDSHSGFYFPPDKDEPSAHGRCELEARRSVHPERM